MSVHSMWSCYNIFISCYHSSAPASDLQFLCRINVVRFYQYCEASISAAKMLMVIPAVPFIQHLFWSRFLLFTLCIHFMMRYKSNHCPIAYRLMNVAAFGMVTFLYLCLLSVTCLLARYQSGCPGWYDGILLPSSVIFVPFRVMVAVLWCYFY